MKNNNTEDLHVLSHQVEDNDIVTKKPRKTAVKKTTVKKKSKVSITDIINETTLTLRANAAKKSDKNSKSTDSKKSKVTIGGGVSYYNAEQLNELDERQEILLESLGLQFLFGTRDLKPGTLLEIIGPEQVGKTTFIFSLVGPTLASNPNIPFLYINSEGTKKIPSTERIESCLHTDKAKAAEILNNQIIIQVSYELQATLESIQQSVSLLRQRMNEAGIDEETTPIIVAVDTISKLIPTAETDLRSLDASVSNLTFSKMLARWTRGLVAVLEKYNVFLIIASHQNTKIQMSGATSAFMTAEAAAASNKTKIGGGGTNQTATNQITLVRYGSDVNATTKEVVSHFIQIKCVKNSRNADQQKYKYELRLRNLKDTDTTYEKAINFDYGLPDYFAETKLFSVTAKTKETFTSKVLIGNASDIVPRQTIIDIFLANEELIQEAVTAKRIRGYPRVKALTDNELTELSPDNTSLPSLTEDDVSGYFDEDQQGISNEDL